MFAGLFIFISVFNQTLAIKVTKGYDFWLDAHVRIPVHIDLGNLAIQQ